MSEMKDRKRRHKIKRGKTQKLRNKISKKNNERKNGKRCEKRKTCHAVLKH